MNNFYLLKVCMATVLVASQIALHAQINLGRNNYIMLNSSGDNNWRFGKDNNHNINLYGYGDNVTPRKFRIIHSGSNLEVLMLTC